MPEHKESRIIVPYSHFLLIGSNPEMVEERRRYRTLCSDSDEPLPNTYTPLWVINATHNSFENFKSHTLKPRMALRLAGWDIQSESPPAQPDNTDEVMRKYGVQYFEDLPEHAYDEVNGWNEELPEEPARFSFYGRWFGTSQEDAKFRHGIVVCKHKNVSAQTFWSHVAEARRRTISQVYEDIGGYLPPTPVQSLLHYFPNQPRR